MKLAVIDKDGTLIQPKSGNTFVQNPTDQILMVGAVEGCQRLINAGYMLAIASNQGGVAAGHKTLDEAIEEMQYCVSLLEAFDIEINRAIFCPDFDGNDCYVIAGSDVYYVDGLTVESFYPLAELVGTFRKPKPGMLKLAEVGRCSDRWMIGDRDEDAGAAEAAGFNFLHADEWRNGASPWII